MSKHTPGPWAMSRLGDDFAIHGGWNNELLVTEMPSNGHPRDAHVEADAHLIAAAPELLEALMAVRLHLMVRPENRLAQADKNVAEIVRAAIAKAEGEP